MFSSFAVCRNVKSVGIIHGFWILLTDDKPVVVVTHGDLLSLSDRVRIRFYLGELLCIPPAQQIFDIPGTQVYFWPSKDLATFIILAFTIHLCLQRATIQLPN